MEVQQRLVSRGIGDFRRRELRAEIRVGEVMQRILVDLQGQSVRVPLPKRTAWSHAHLCDPGSEEAAHEVLPPLELGLDDDEAKVGLGVHIARHLLDLFNLQPDAIVDALNEAILRPPVSAHQHCKASMTREP
jgi:hypothetical protein